MEFTTPGIDPKRFWEAIVKRREIIKKLTAPSKLNTVLIPDKEEEKTLKREGETNNILVNKLVKKYTKERNKTTFKQIIARTLITLSYKNWLKTLKPWNQKNEKEKKFSQDQNND